MTESSSAQPATKRPPSPVSGKVAALCAALIGSVGILCFFKLPQSSPLFAFAEAGLLLAVMPLIFWQQANGEKASRFASITCAIFWVLGILLAFLIPPRSVLTPIPDLLLLLGFLPLLFLWRFSFPWIIFGLIDIAIGLLLQTVEFLPNDPFPPDLQKAKAHLAEYHPPLSWYIIGTTTLIFGWSRFAKNMIALGRRRKNNTM